jgi:outer membrane protein assembly factor BamD (BamD/ComL family)
VWRPDKEGEDPAQVLEAIRSLRATGNAWRASVLLDDYLREHPRGILTEDALALAIEAADARHDRGTAAEYAERYIRQYPSGRFRPLADEALRRRGQ